ncbi:MAG: ergothioneine biosynthesis protein EgtB [Rhodospirillales bacterium]|nr:ergothioneine biosynthesis protein EgtB [Rhodospirillales bacterium]
MIRPHQKPSPSSPPSSEDLRQRFDKIRSDSLGLVRGLSDADATVQSMADASPAKWHLAHTTWFFETVIVQPHLADYPVFDPAYAYLFNSYYEALGPRHARPARGLLTRPRLDEVLAYRAHVDRAMAELLARDDLAPALLDSIELGLNHEQQHQELLLTDLLHLFAQNPLKPEYRSPVPLAQARPATTDPLWLAIDGGVHRIGHAGDGFAFDCEGPAHDALIAPFELAAAPVTVGQWIEFMDDGGYANPLLWLADGWARVSGDNWAAPLYWEIRDGDWWTMTLHGFQPVDRSAPVCHVSYFEADAYARWAGQRLPSEFEWELAATATTSTPPTGHFADKALYRPLPAGAGKQGLAQLYGDVWEWTQSPYMAYPGFRPAPGIAAEYNGKFMSGQFVLRGGSCVTPPGHIRASYRNFFYPHQRWQFSGVRLARDV